MDRFTRNYLIILGSIATIIFIIWLASLDPRVRELNDLLDQHPQLHAYAYRFKVLSLENGVATRSTSRSSQAPAVPLRISGRTLYRKLKASS